MTARLSTGAGDLQSRRLKLQVVELVNRKHPAVKLSVNESLDQLVRHAARLDVELFLMVKP